MERNCSWLKDENAGMRPSGYRVPNETGNSAADCKSTGNHIEYLLCDLTFPTDNKILLDPNIWITDTAASVHMTAHRTGLINVVGGGRIARNVRQSAAASSCQHCRTPCWRASVLYAYRIKRAWPTFLVDIGVCASSIPRMSCTAIAAPFAART
jgi:hypothetical protein